MLKLTTKSEDEAVVIFIAMFNLFIAFVLGPWLGAWALAACIEYYGPLIAHHPFEIHVFSRFFLPLIVGGFFLARFAIPLALLGWLLTIFGVLAG